MGKNPRKKVKKFLKSLQTCRNSSFHFSLLSMIPSFVFALLGNFLRLKLLNMYICLIPKVKVETYSGNSLRSEPQSSRVTGILCGPRYRGSRVCNMGLFPLEKLKSITNYIDQNSEIFLLKICLVLCLNKSEALEAKD